MGILDIFLQSGGGFASLLAAASVLLLVYALSSALSSQETENEPPGPRPLPVLGNLLQLDLKRPYNTLVEMSKKYGPVFTVYLGSKKVVVLAGYKAVKEALVNHAEEFGDRDVLRIVKQYNDGHGIIWSNGDSWKEMRRFALTNLRDFGMGRKACEEKIIEECQHVLEVFRNFRGEAFDTTQPINYAVSNIICSIVYGNRFDYKDPEFTAMVDGMNRKIQLAGLPSAQVYNLFPWLGKRLPQNKEFFRLTVDYGRKNLEIFRRLRESLNPLMCRSLVDSFFVRKEHLEESGITNSHFHDENLMWTVQNLFAAGTDTTAATLRWSLLLMAKYPDIQEKVHEELSRVIGDRQVQVEDRKNLPFTDAVIHETQRLANIAPMALPHRTSQDVVFRGYFIKKYTTVYVLLTSVLHDDSEWEKPHSFHPDHFLDKDGNFVKNDAFMPFSAGRRACLGESLARMELFLFFVTLLQHFHFRPPLGVSEDQLDLTPRVGFTISPTKHMLRALDDMRGRHSTSLDLPSMDVSDAFCSPTCSSVLGSLLVLLLAYVAWSSASGSQGSRREPPGPRPLPLLGNLLRLNLNGLHWSLLEMSKKYGPVFTFHMGPKKVVVLAGYKAVKEALVQHGEEFGERDPLNTVKESKLEHGVLWNNGDSWKEMRRFALSNLRDFGMGKKACEDKIIEECQHLLEVFRNFRGEAFDNHQPINYAVSNIICSLVFGSRFQYDDPAFTAMVQRSSRSVQILGGPSLQLYNMFPWLGKWFSWLGKWFSSAREELRSLGMANRKQATELIQHLKETLNPQSSRGFVDAFLIRQQRQEESGDVGHFHNQNLLITVSNLFVAGTETTSTTLRWALLFMAKYPHIQEKVHEELNRVIGDHQVQVEDRKNLPFTDAVIHETQRLGDIVPMALPHRTSQDVTFRGYFIKKGTTVHTLLTSVLRDESEWQKPGSFYPEHFLDKEGKFIRPDAFMPFSAGRRICLGESLARMELFIFFVTLLQHFRFRPPPGISEDQLDLTPRAGFTLSPTEHKLCAVSVSGQAG
ncbi:uncharacterized protein LOC133417371 [Phycodurus eques]|uniref:uncharacterized protein LOC133417371 n=1 Tax=Phycodurus eques TaxID=693459 RepID=UPI002ACDD5E1|nr:uncharacterized protein LOC133417371 [Phycodurus eques]